MGEWEGRLGEKDGVTLPPSTILPMPLPLGSLSLLESPFLMKTMMWLKNDKEL